MEVMEVLTLLWLSLIPFAFVYFAIKVRIDIAQRRWIMVALGAAAFLQPLGVLIHFGFIWEIVRNGGL